MDGARLGLEVLVEPEAGDNGEMAGCGLICSGSTVDESLSNVCV